MMRMNGHSFWRGRLRFVRGHAVAAVPVLVAAVLCLSNCSYGGGGSNSGGGVSGNYLIVTPYPGAIQVGTAVVFTSAAQGSATNTPVWDLYTGLPGLGTLSNASAASITYTAPATPPIYPAPSPLPQGSVRLEAMSGSYSGAVFFYVTAPTITAGISPTTASVALGKTQQFYGYGVGGINPNVTWQVNGATGGGLASGTITNAGVYTAPVAFPMSGKTVTVTAVSVLDPTKTASAVVTLM